MAGTPIATAATATVGLIANPASGRDIRRLVAHASVVSTDEKVRIIRRLLLALDAAGVPRVLYMPDTSHLVVRAAREQPLQLDLVALQGNFHGAPDDTTSAARLLAAARVACIVSLGGDGTNRAIALGDTSVPLIPLSTGTNNVFPTWRESTVAGLAAAAFATDAFATRASATSATMSDRIAPRSKLIEVDLPGRRDLALIDVAVLHGNVIGSRAIWEPEQLRQLVLTRADPAAVGLAAIGGAIASIGPADDAGLHLTFAPESTGASEATGAGPTDRGQTVRVALAPGLLRPFHITAVQPLHLAAIVPVAGPALLAFDGEREVALAADETATLRLTRNGPPVVDIDACLTAARDAGFFIPDTPVPNAPARTASPHEASTE